MSHKPMFTEQEQLLIDAAAALKLAEEVAGERYSTPKTTEIQRRLMDLVHEMRKTRIYGDDRYE